MPTMNTVVHYSCSMPGATPAEMHHAEQLMRDTDYIETITQMTNIIATMHARKAGVTKPFEITGTIHTVDHLP